MPSSSTRSVRAGSVFVEFFGKDGRLMETVKRVGQKLRTFGASISMSGMKVAGMGAAIAAPIAAAVGNFVSLGSEISDASQRTGIAAEQLSTLGYAAKQSGAEMDDLIRGVGKMQQHLADAASGSESAQQAFSDLGLSAESLAGMSTDKQFRTVAEAVSKIGDPAQRASAAMDIFGKSGMQLMPMLREGRSGLKAMEDRARDLGLVMSGESVSAADKLGDLFDDIWAQAKKLTYEIGSALAPAVTSASESVANIAAIGIGWVQQNRKVITTVAGVAVGLISAGAAIAAFGGVIWGVGLALSGLAGAYAIVAGVVGAVVSPLGLTVAAISGLVYWSGAGGKALGWLREQFGPLYDTASQVVGAISNAMSAGNWEAAGNAAWAGLKLAWVQGSQIVQGIWRDFSTGLENTFFGTIDVITKAFKDLASKIESIAAGIKNKTASLLIDIQAAAHKDSKWSMLGNIFLPGAGMAISGAIGMSKEDAAKAQAELKAMGDQEQSDILREMQARDGENQSKSDKREADATAARNKSLAEARDALQKARDEADSAIQAAINAKPEIKPGSAMAKLQNTDWEAAMNNAAMQVKAPSPGGTFSRLASQMFGAKSQDQMAKDQLAVQKQIAVNTKKMAEWSLRYTS